MPAREMSEPLSEQRIDVRTVFGWIAAALWLFVYIPYSLAVFGFDLWKGPITPAKPAIATWLIFFVLDVVVLVGMYAKNELNWQICVATAGALWTTVLAYMYGVSGWTPIDTVCLTGAALGVVLWSYFREANWGIVIGSTAMVIGVVPTVISTWIDPSHENLIAWSIGTLSCVFQIASVRSLTIAALAQPIGFFIIEASVALALIIKGGLL